MDYEKEIQESKRFINPKSPKIMENNSTYYRNRLIDYAAKLAVRIPNYSTIKCEYRAEHYGVSIGTRVLIGYTIINNQLAAAKKDIRELLNIKYRKLWVVLL